MLKRLGIFIFVIISLSIAMVASKESQHIEKLNVNSTEILSLNNGSATNFRTSLSPKEIVEKLDATIVSKQTLKNENLEIYYCFVENVSSFVVENGKKINLQIANNGEFSIVGFPLILTGY